MEPSSTTTVRTGRPHATAGSRRTTSPTVAASLWTGITATTGASGRVDRAGRGGGVRPSRSRPKYPGAGVTSPTPPTTSAYAVLVACATSAAASAGAGAGAESDQRRGRRRLVPADAAGGDRDRLRRDRHRGHRDRLRVAQPDPGRGRRRPHHRGLQQPGHRGGQRHPAAGQPDRRPAPPQHDQPADRGDPGREQRGGQRPAPDAEPAGHRGRGHRREREHGEQVGRPQRDRGGGHRRRRQRGPAQHAGHPQRLAQPERQHVVAQQRDVQRRPRLPERQPRQHPAPGPGPQHERAGVEHDRAEQRGRVVGDRLQRRAELAQVDHRGQVADGDQQAEHAEPAAQPPDRQRPRQAEPRTERGGGAGHRGSGHGGARGQRRGVRGDDHSEGRLA